MRPTEVIFEVTEAVEGGYDARALGYSIFTQGDDWDDLKDMVKDAVLCHFDEGRRTKSRGDRPVAPTSVNLMMATELKPLPLPTRIPECRGWGRCRRIGRCYRFALLLHLSPLQANSTVSYCRCTWTEVLFVFLRSKRSAQM